MRWNEADRGETKRRENSRTDEGEARRRHVQSVGRTWRHCKRMKTDIIKM